MKTLGALIERNAHFYPDQIGLVYGKQHYTHSEYNERSNRLASALYGLGVRHQDRVSILSMNCSEYLEVFAACYLSGFIASTVNFRLAIPEIHYILNDSAPRILIFESQYAAVIDSLRDKLASIEHFICIGDGPAWALQYADVIASGDKIGSPIFAMGDDIAHLIYTSGTTGRPKGVLRSHRCELAQARAMATSLDIRPESKVLEVMPYFHVGAQSSGSAAWWRGATVMVQRGFDPSTVLRTIAQEKITTLHLVPLMIQALLDAPDIDSYDLSSLETILYAAAPMPVPIVRRALQKFGPIFVNAWGQTEGNGTMLPKHMHKPEGSPKEVKRLASIGQAQQDTELRIVDEAGNDCLLGEPGELILQSDVMMQGYWNNPAATQDTLRDGWLRTGDVGYFDEIGCIYLVDRKKDMIISGGENIYSQEVEQALAEHPAVANAAVIGVPDLKWGETVKAIIVLKPGCAVDSEDLIAHCIKFIASYKRPRNIVIVNELPVLASGKINKRELRALYGRVENGVSDGE